MTRRFRGEFVHKLDSKGRVSVPAPFRRVLEESDPNWKTGDNPMVVVVHSLRAGPSLDAFSVEAHSRVEADISKMPYGGQRNDLEKIFGRRASEMFLDENGRIVLSAALRERLGNPEEVVFAGMNERFQIWEPRAYAEDMEKLDATLEGMADIEDPMALLNQVRQGG